MEQFEETARNIKLIIAYDGTAFSGWQIQQNQRTVQGCVEAALEKIHGKRIPVHAAGRTDSGVHAAGQCVNFITNIRTINAPQFVPALNSLLPPDVRIRASSEVPPSFHARFSAQSRTYRYYLVPGMCNLPHETRYAMQMARVPNLALLQQYARLILGETDCSVFASPSDPIFQHGSGSRFRRITGANFFMQERKLVFEISANAFFRRMVRSILGTFLFYAEKGCPAETFREILKAGERKSAGPTAIPNGLFLWNVEYDPQRLFLSAALTKV